MPTTSRKCRKVSAVDRNGREYSQDEMILVFKTFYGKNTSVIYKMFPDLNESTISKRAAYYGLNDKEKFISWTDAELETLKRYAPDYAKIKSLLHGRTAKAIRRKCEKLKLSRPGPGDYSPEEDDMLRRCEKPPGRSERSMYSRCTRLGVNRLHLKAVMKLGPSALRERIGGLIPKGLPSQIRDDAIQAVITLCLEGKCSPSEATLRPACKRAVTATWKMHPDKGAPISMDARLFDDGTATVGDRIDSEAFHF